jgi:hypothetical protein
MRFFALGFFHESSSPKPLKKHWCHFDFVRKFTEIFASHGAPSVSMTSVENLPSVSTTPTANFATGTARAIDINNTGGCQRHHW